MPRQDRQDQKDLLSRQVQQSRHRQAPKTEDHESKFKEHSRDDTKIWSDNDTPSDIADIGISPRRREAAGRRIPRQHTIANPTGPSYDTRANASTKPGVYQRRTSSYYPSAGGQLAHYGAYNYPLPQPYFGHLPNSNPTPPNYHPSAHHPVENYPGGPYHNSNGSYFPNYFQGSSYPGAAQAYSTEGYRPVVDPYYESPYQRQPQPSPHYAPIPGSHPLQPPAAPSPLERQLEEVLDELDEARQIANKKQAELAAIKAKKKEDELRRNFKRQAKAEVEKMLGQERSLADSDARSDPGRMPSRYDRRPFPIRARTMQDALLVWEDLRDRESSQIVQDLAQLLVRHRGQEALRSLGGSNRSLLDELSTRQLEGISRALHPASASATFRAQVEDVVIDLLLRLRMDEKQMDPLFLPRAIERAASDRYTASEVGLRTQDWQSKPPSIKRNPQNPSSSHETVPTYNHQELRRESGSSTGRQQNDSKSLRAASPKPDSRKSWEHRNELKSPRHSGDRGADPLLDRERERFDSGYSSTRTGPSNGAPEMSSNKRSGGGYGQSVPGPDLKDRETLRERPESQAKSKGRRPFNPELMKGILTSDESEQTDSSSYSRKRAPYPPLKGDRMPMAPEPPVRTLG